MLNRPMCENREKYYWANSSLIKYQNGYEGLIVAKNIEPKFKKIGDYLKLEEETVFTIPEYQRAYSWSIDNCDKLWQDINDFVESESKDITKYKSC